METELLTYDTVARFSMVASLLLFMALFLAVLVYVFLIASRDGLEKAQRDALDLKNGKSKLGEQT